MLETICGSPLNMAPELLGFSKYDDSVDIWALGVIIYEMVVGKKPFKAKSWDLL